ncbi:hypothetical protein [Hydrogenophaga atypica]|uniref:Uncharacterized protein n=1 Tax=Hydrogenophaga atypica TaxID=249409 RepID=A0ABW2QH23_9BURK
MDEMTSAEKFKLPYTLLLDPETGRAAAYSQNHRLLTETASDKLVAWARANHVKQAVWDAAMHDPSSQHHPLPSWATPAVLARCVLLWVREGGQPDDWLRQIPRR